MASLANVLNILQAETKIYRGYLLPVLSELRDQLILLRDLLLPNRHTDLRDQASQRDLSSSNTRRPAIGLHDHLVRDLPASTLIVNTYKPLINRLLAWIEKRFSIIMNDPEAIAATILYTKFKNSWTEAEVIIAKGLKYIRTALTTLAKASDSSYNAAADATEAVKAELSEVSKTRQNVNDDDRTFFMTKRHLQNTFIAGILDKFLNNPSTEVTAVAVHPLLKELFIKLNASLPASAVIERLFSFTSLIMFNKRSRMSDGLFENLEFLRNNVTLLP